MSYITKMDAKTKKKYEEYTKNMIEIDEEIQKLKIKQQKIFKKIYEIEKGTNKK